MSERFTPRTTLLGLSVACCLVAAPAVAGCRAGLDALADALRRDDGAAVKSLLVDIQDGLDEDCSPTTSRAARRLYSDALLRQAARLATDAGQKPRVLALTREAAGLNVSWQATKALGDILMQQRAYREAKATYDAAVGLLEADDFKDAPSGATLADFRRKADEASALELRGGGGPTRSPKGRDGFVGGRFSPALGRGPVGSRVPAPIVFEYNSDQLTPAGRDVLAEVIQVFNDRKPQRITVAGHTDRVGSDAFNMDLSRRRAERVKAELAASGIAARITVVAKGKSEPRELSDAVSFTQDEIDDLNRRVEFDWRS